MKKKKFAFNVTLLHSINGNLDIAQVEKVLSFSRETIRSLEKSKRIKRKSVGNKYLYDKKSIVKFVKSFNLNDYLTISKVNDELKANGIVDDFGYFGEGLTHKKCKYKRYVEAFPMSATQLIKRGYLEIDMDIKPVLVKKLSLQNAMNDLRKTSTIQPSNNVATSSEIAA